MRFIMFGFGPFGMILVGSIAEFIGTQWALGISAASGAALLTLIVVMVKTGDASESSEAGKESLPLSPAGTVESKDSPSHTAA